MNQTQLRYARQRAQEMLEDKQKTLRAKHLTKAVQFTVDDKIQAIKDGRYELTRRGGIHSLEYNIKFPEETPSRLDQEAFDKEYAPVLKAFNTMMDELVLGDNEVALKLMKAFEAL